ncbi:hypothetical protein TI03_02880 [Achromatium sp. WMS1]|nr:hypothetical protein TI03_02880 [Achromatium sp. WMS1]
MNAVNRNYVSLVKINLIKNWLVLATFIIPILSLFAPQIMAAATTSTSATTANSVVTITNQARVEYWYQGTTFTAQSNTVSVTVRPVAGMSWTTNDTVTAIPDSWITIAYRLQNIGNTELTNIVLTISNLAGDAFDLENIEFYEDRNRNGVLDEGEPRITRVSALALGGSVDLLIRGKIPANVIIDSDARITVRATSSADTTATHTTTIRAIEAATIQGKAWLDVNHDGVYQQGEPLLGGYVVELLCDRNYIAYNRSIGGPVGGCQTPPPDSPYAQLLGYEVIATTTTGFQDANLGKYCINFIPPGDGYALRFKFPNSNQVLGNPINQDTENNSSSYVEYGVLKNIILSPGITIIEQNLPLDPSGVVYDAVTRQPIAGATVTLEGPPDFDPAVHTTGGTNTMVTGTDGFYQFWFFRDTPAGLYTLSVSAPDYTSPSALITSSGRLINPRATANCTGKHCVQPQAVAPTSQDNNLLTYYLEFDLNFPSGDVDVVNNHIPLDPDFGSPTSSVLIIEKTAARQTVELGDFLDYTIQIRNLSVGTDFPDIKVYDRLPYGFVYVPNTARFNNTRLASEPASRTQPIFNVGSLAAGENALLRYRVRIGPGSMRGDGINRAYATTLGGRIRSNTSYAKVRITPGVFTNDAYVIGRVFLDCNLNGVKDPKELGIPGVKLILQNGVGVTTDSNGAFSLYGLRPRTHVLRLDDSSLPKGAKLFTTSQRHAKPYPKLKQCTKASPEIEQALRACIKRGWNSRHCREVRSQKRKYLAACRQQDRYSESRANSRFIDLSNGELHKANFAVGCDYRIVRKVKALIKEYQSKEETMGELANRLQQGFSRIVK